MQFTTGLVLRRLNVEVSLAGTTAEALEHIRRDHFDLALVDLRLPDQSGLELARLFRAERLAIPWILMSGFMDCDAALEAGKLGALRVVHIPFDVEAVVFEALCKSIQPSNWPSVPLASRLVAQPGTSAHYWAHLVLKACDSESDIRTLQDWAVAVAVSYSSLTEASRIIGIDPHAARDFARIWRGLLRTRGDVSRLESELLIADYRTRKRLFHGAGLTNVPGPLAPGEYIERQLFVPAHHPALSATLALVELL